MRIIVSGNEEAAAREFRELLLRGKYSVEVYLLNPAEVVDRMIQFRPDAVFLLQGQVSEDVLPLVEEIRDILPVRIVIVGPEVESKAVLRLLREGVYHYLNQHEAEGELAELMQRFRLEPPVVRNMGRIISILGAGGGVGATTLGVNVGMQLAVHSKRCVLLDLRLQGGDAATLLDLQPAHTLVDFCRNASRMDDTMFERCLARHAKGLHVLAGPRGYGETAQVTGRGIRRAMNMARRAFDYVLVDLDGVHRPHETHALLQTDIVLIVLRLDFASVRKAKQLLDFLHDLEIDDSRVRLIVNQFRRAGELSVRDVEKVLGRRISLYVPEDARRVNASNNSGIPVVLQHPRSPASKSIQLIAASVNGHMSGQGAAVLSSGS